MMIFKKLPPVLALLALWATALFALGQTTPPATPAAPAPAITQDPRARALLDEAKAKFRALRSLVADYQINRRPTQNFDREGEISLERPARFRVESIRGAVVEERALISVSDGSNVTRLEERNFVAYLQPVHSENFFLGQNTLVQLFFSPREIAFDPTDSTWGRSLSQFDTNVAAYDRDTALTYLGRRVLEGVSFEVVEIKYNTKRYDVRQQFYVGPDKFIYQVDTSIDGDTTSQKFRNFRFDTELPPETWRAEKPAKMPDVTTDPARLGERVPEFTLPGANGGEITLASLLQGKKGLYVCTLNGAIGRMTGNADYHLAQMRVLQDLKNRFEPQGLAIVCIVGGSSIVPQVKNEMMLNWMPDISRFNYPIAIDIDLERGIQGSAYQNFQVDGRNNLLLDGEGRVVFAAQNFTDKVNLLAFYQALAQLGFTVSPADMEDAAR